VEKLADKAESLLTSSSASLLEDANLWANACFVYQHLPGEAARSTCVRTLIHRRFTAEVAATYMPPMAPSSGCTDLQAFLVDRLSLPERWLFEGLAFDAEYRGDDQALASALLYAGDLTRAHRVIMDRLAAKMVASGKFHALKALLSPLEAGSHGFASIPGFEVRGKLVLMFLELRQGCTALAAGRVPPASSEQEIQSRLTGLAAEIREALPRMPVKNNSDRLLRSEIASWVYKVLEPQQETAQAGKTLHELPLTTSSRLDALPSLTAAYIDLLA
jgi:nuclear pore complex protein Nup98-Nup96